MFYKIELFFEGLVDFWFTIEQREQRKLDREVFRKLLSKPKSDWKVEIKSVSTRGSARHEYYSFTSFDKQGVPITICENYLGRVRLYENMIVEDICVGEEEVFVNLLTVARYFRGGKCCYKQPPYPYKGNCVLVDWLYNHLVKLFWEDIYDLEESEKKAKISQLQEQNSAIIGNIS